ncbi:MAG: 50S ribosomal protein L4 [Chloroflexi bacterium]|nr:50S ribosomal protein L4 [Chloroflexota bacterium]
MEIPVYNLDGEITRHISVSEQLFGVPVNEGVIHQAMVRQLANARQGTASTKTRSEVSGSSRKLYRQKGTGSARAGNRRSPIRRGGGVIFGPKPRDYRLDMPRKMRRLALRSALSAKVGDGELKIVEELNFDLPETKRMARVLEAMGAERSALIVTGEPEANVIKSARNLSGTKTLPASLLNVLDVVSYKTLLMTESAVRKAEQLWGQIPAGEEDHASV